MKPANFNYKRATDLKDALALLAEFGPRARVLAGGQSLMPMLNLRLAQPEIIVDIAGLTELQGIDHTSDLRVGALVKQRDAELSPTLISVCPLVPRALRYVGHPPIRHQGTLGGSIAHADPSAELPAIMIAMDAEFVIASATNQRIVPATEFFVSAFTTTLRPDELLVQIILPIEKPRQGSAILEISRRSGDFAQAGIVIVLCASSDGALEDVRLVGFALGSTARRLRQVEATLEGTMPDESSVARAREMLDAEVGATDDIHATAGYRRHVLGVIFERALTAARADSMTGRNGRQR
jgi:carbon-monoxide dehydrogenase medium subunit